MDYIANVGYVDKKFEGSWSDIYMKQDTTPILKMDC